jgi:RTA1 like protein
MILNIGLKITAYVTRVIMHNNDFNRNLFIIYIYAITLGPIFISAAIYLCLSRIVIVYDEGISSFKPRTYAISFIIGDFLALSLQGAGGGMLQVQETQDIRLRMLITGLGFQVLSLTVFALACAEFA